MVTIFTNIDSASTRGHAGNGWRSADVIFAYSRTVRGISETADYYTEVDHRNDMNLLRQSSPRVAYCITLTLPHLSLLILKLGIMELPTLDLSRYCEQGNTEAAFYDQVLEQCSKYGFVKFIGHGIEDNLVAEAFEWVSVSISPPPHYD